MTEKETIWVIIPAAGVGSRMKSSTPKQYMELNGKAVISHTISVFDHHPAVKEIVIAISPTDEYWADTDQNFTKTVNVTEGGKERCDSVLNGLNAIANRADDNDWVMVHDAARPCLRKKDIDHLIDSLSNNDVGGILAVPVRDTMKLSFSEQGDKAGCIKETVNRDNLWHALTPQMFRYGLLRQSLSDALVENRLVTDEASAIEQAGYNPLLVEGHADNLKITRPEDLELAAFYLRQQENS